MQKCKRHRFCCKPCIICQGKLYTTQAGVVNVSTAADKMILLRHRPGHTVNIGIGLIRNVLWSILDCVTEF